MRSVTAFSTCDFHLPGNVSLYYPRHNVMFGATSLSAPHALSSVSNLLDSLSLPAGPMPSPNVGTKNAARKTAERKPAEFGAQLGRKRSQDFASKIQGWNQGGAGVVQQQDEVIVVEEDESEVGKKEPAVIEVITEPTEVADVGVVTPEDADQQAAPTTFMAANTPGKSGAKNAASPRTSKEVDLERKAWVRRKSKPQLEVAAEVKHAGTPKKRVISDGHWRRDRAAKAEPANPEKGTPPKPVAIRRSVVSVGLKVPSQEFGEEDNQSPVKVRALRQARSRSPTGGREGTPDYEDSGVKVYIKRRKRSKTSDELTPPTTSQSSLVTATSGERAPSTDLTVLTKSTAPEKQSPAANASKRKPVDRAAEDERGKRKPSDRKPKENAVPVPAVKPASNLPPVFSNRIQGWLAHTTDPFVEEREASLTPEPLHVRRRRSRQTTDDAAEEEDQRRSMGRRRRSRASLDRRDALPISEGSDYSPASTPVLKRSGARRATSSPVKDRPGRSRHLSCDDDDAATIISNADLHRKVSRRGTGHGYSKAGRQRSTIASAESMRTGRPRAPSDASERPTVITEGSILSRVSDGDVPRRHGTGLKRGLAKHTALVSGLSIPRDRPDRGVSRRSTRSRKPLATNTTIGGLMSELTTEELKYQRELRTMVDGVIPVLLSHVLQRTGATGAKRLFSGSSLDGQAVTRPIVEMGVALEKLKATHKRIPLHDPDELLRWAQTASNRYEEYIKAWRLGFQDVVVNLAPADEAQSQLAVGSGVLPSKEAERADVQCLLKRPLIRLKNLAELFRSIKQLKPSDLADEMIEKYQALTQEARHRVRDEKGRLEDEAAANIDPSRARDPRSLSSLEDVFIDPTRSVRARDYFDLEVIHSNGQQLTCKVELIIRDDAPGRGSSSDVLFCEVSVAGRWLLFPPIPASYLSARDGDKDGELVVMVRGMLAPGREWRELMLLKSDDDGTLDEWLDMLGSKPVPPRLTKQSSFNTLRDAYTMSGGLGARPPAPSEVDVPIGERARRGAMKWDGSEVNSVVGDLPQDGGLRRAKAKRYRSTPSSPLIENAYEQVHARAEHIARQERYEGERVAPPRSRYRERPKSSYIPAKSEWSSVSGDTLSRKDYSVWMPSTDRKSDSEGSEEDDRNEPFKPSRPSFHRRTSSVPSMDMPTVNKLRRPQSQTPTRAQNGCVTDRAPPDDPRSAPAKLHKNRPTPEKEPATPRSRPTSLGLKTGILPSFTPAFLKRHRRASSPLKHEYEPSTASESLSDSEVSDVDDAESVTSESSGEDPAVSVLGELKDFRDLGSLRPHGVQVPRPKSVYSNSVGSVRPSESASQAPYRSVPQTDIRSARTVACIFAWADSGTWESLHPQECSIVVTPGMIEAFDLLQAQAAMANTDRDQIKSPSQKGVRPLIALELTPLVPLRRGTAVDISIRSPPTDKSLIRTGNNIMLRSQNPEDCEKLYHLINRARIDNPTFIALQSARGPVPTSNWAEIMDKRNAARTSGSSSPWLRFGSRKGSTYRSKGSRALSTAATESSVATMNTAFSALRRFSGGNKSIFNIGKSTLTSREGSRSTYSDSLSSGAATPMPIDPSFGTPLGITNSKIRLYIRESASKWRDMGSARLSILLPPRPPGGAANPANTGTEKRILICGKSKGETILDVTLGESAFERVARTGIAMSVWEEALGPNGEAIVGAAGGVSNARSRIYMLQMKSVSRRSGKIA